MSYLLFYYRYRHALRRLGTGSAGRQTAFDLAVVAAHPPLARGLDCWRIPVRRTRVVVDIVRLAVAVHLLLPTRWELHHVFKCGKRVRSQHLRCHLRHAFLKHLRHHPVRCEQAAAQCRAGMCGILEDGTTALPLMNESRACRTNGHSQNNLAIFACAWTSGMCHLWGWGCRQRGREEGTHCRFWRRGGRGWSGCRGCGRGGGNRVNLPPPTDSRCIPSHASETSRPTARGGCGESR